jgi:hypothetical protein
MRHSLIAPRSYKGRPTSQARWRRTWSGRNGASRRAAARSVNILFQVCLAHFYKGASPPAESPRRGRTPFETPGKVLPPTLRPRAPVTRGVCAISRRTVMNNAG